MIMYCTRVLSATTRPNWREERKLNVETFGARSASMYSRRVGYRGSRGRAGRGGFMRAPMNRGRTVKPLVIYAKSCKL